MAARTKTLAEIREDAKFDLKYFHRKRSSAYYGVKINIGDEFQAEIPDWTPENLNSSAARQEPDRDVPVSQEYLECLKNKKQQLKAGRAWTENERFQFAQLTQRFGKDFALIAKHVGFKS
jgi:hypothetical protein